MTNPLIQRLRLQTNLGERDLALIERISTATRHVAAGADIAPQGERPRSLHVLVDGWAARFKSLTNGRQQFPALFLPGDVCDLDGLQLRTIHSGVRALTPCDLVLIPHAQLREAIDRRPAIRDAFWWMGCVENAMATEWSFGLGRRSAGERLGHLLCELLVRLRTVGLAEGDGYELPLSQVELADVLGLSPVHLNRVIQGMRSGSLLTMKNRWLRIDDVDRLARMSHFDPDYLHLEGLHPDRKAERPATRTPPVGDSSAAR